MTPAATVGEDERLRLFLALQLPGTTLDVLEDWRDEHLTGGRPVPRDSLHVTPTTPAGGCVKVKVYRLVPGAPITLLAGTSFN